MSVGVHDFLEELPSHVYERSVRITGHIQHESSPDEVAHLEREYEEVKKCLDVLNERRNRLRIQKEDIEAVIGHLRTRTPGNAELIPFGLMLQGFCSNIEREINQTRPDELHKQKSELRTEIANRKLLAQLMGILGRK